MLMAALSRTWRQAALTDTCKHGVVPAAGRHGHERTGRPEVAGQRPALPVGARTKKAALRPPFS
ncbi:hypothetical protein DL544_08760 [Stenotrophomonas sp. pho]|nr:hypothetical protein DL544_08760 [Stenotrophomonas sp. pho]